MKASNYSHGHAICNAHMTLVLGSGWLVPVSVLTTALNPLDGRDISRGCGQLGFEGWNRYTYIQMPKVINFEATKVQTLVQMLQLKVG